MTPLARALNRSWRKAMGKTEMSEQEVSTVVPNSVVEVPDPLRMMADAVAKGYRADDLKVLLELQRAVSLDRAKDTFGLALSNFQAACPPVVKSKSVKNKDGTDRYKFAPYDDVMTVVKPHLSDNKISVSFFVDESTESKEVVIICRLQVGMYHEDRPFTFARFDGEQLSKLAAASYRSVSQYEGELLTYRRRYALCGALNIVVCNEDEDTAPQNATLDEKQITEINRLLEECEKSQHPVNLESFHKWLGISESKNLAEVPAVRFSDITIYLNKTRRGEKKK